MTIRIKLYALAIVAVFGLSILVVLGELGRNELIRAQELQDATIEVQVLMLQARRAEKNFLQRKDMQYVRQVHEHVALAQMQVERLLTENSSLTDEYRKLRDLFMSYLAAFNAVVQAMQEQGLNEKIGLTGALRESVHQVESVLKNKHDSELTAQMLMLRRREKDFMLRGDAKYVDLFSADLAEMHQALEQSPLYDYSVKADIAKRLTSYGDDFLAYAAKAARIADQEKIFIDIVRRVEPLLEELAGTVRANREQGAVRMQRHMLIGASATGLLVLVVIVFLARNILHAVHGLGSMSRQVADGDHDACLRVAFSGELEALRLDIVHMVGTLKANMEAAKIKEEEAVRHADSAARASDDARLQREQAEIMLQGMTRAVGKAQEIAVSLASAAEELSAQTEEVSRGMQTQLGLVRDTATAMEQMNATVMDVASSASRAASGAENARATAEEGGRIVGDVTASTAKVEVMSRSMAESLRELGGQVEAIGRIMDMISDIADQTNLLALNAAIEAARAGEAGRGFAVVADEVRKLAEKTMAATREVEVTIGGIQAGTQKSIREMDEAGAAVAASSGLAEKAGVALGQILEIISDTASQVRSIATAAEEQSATSEQISSSSDEVRRISEVTSSSMDQSSEAIRGVAAMAGRLRTVIEELDTLSR